MLVPFTEKCQFFATTNSAVVRRERLLGYTNQPANQPANSAVVRRERLLGYTFRKPRPRMKAAVVRRERLLGYTLFTLNTVIAISCG